MPVREGFYTSGGQAAAGGAFSGLHDFFQQLLGERFKDLASERTLKREQQFKQYNETLDRVKSGETTPEEASTVTGLPAEHFRTFVPSEAATLGKLNTQLKPGTSDEEANVLMHAQAPFRNTPDVATTSPFAEPGSLSYESPLQEKISKLLEAKRAQEDSDAPVTKIGEDASVINPGGFGVSAGETETGNVPPTPIGQDVQNQNVYGRYSKRTGGMEIVGRVPAGPRASETGMAEGAKAIAAAPGQGAAQVAVENALRPAKVESARAEQQSKIDTETSPANTQKEARNKSVIEYATTRARDEAMQAGVSPQIANTFLRSTATGRKYVNFPAGTPKEVIQVGMNQLSKVPDVRFVNPQQESALQAIDTARANYQNIIDLVMKHAAKDYKGNLMQAPRNQLAVWIKSDPDLAAAISGFPQQIQALRAVAGQFGRITQQEIFRAIGSFPQITDPGSVIVSKRGLFYNSLENAENGILGPANAK